MSVVNTEKLSRKQLSKLGIRLMKLYGVDPELCPNITNEKYLKNLKYLMYRRYVDMSIQYEPWQELVLECLTQAEYLQETFIDMLTNNSDYKEIDFWLKKLNLEADTLPSYV